MTAEEIAAIALAMAIANRHPSPPDYVAEVQAAYVPPAPAPAP